MIGTQIPSLLSFSIAQTIEKTNLHSKRLFIGDLPKDLSASHVKEKLTQLFPKSKTIEVYSDLCLDHPNNRGFAFISYDTHEEARDVRLKIRSERPKFLGHNISCDWAQEEHHVPDDVMKSVRVLFVRNVNKTVSEDELRDHFGGSELGVSKVKIQKNFAFVHFDTRENAEASLNRLNGQLLHGHSLEIQWSKPQPTKQLKIGHASNSIHSSTTTSPYNIPNRTPAISVAAPPPPQLSQMNMIPTNIANLSLTLPTTYPLVNYPCVPPVAFLPSTADISGNVLWMAIKKACTDMGYHIPIICTVVFNVYRPLLEQQFKSSLVMPTGEQYHSQMHVTQMEAENDVIIEAYRDISRDISHHLFSGLLQLK